METVTTLMESFMFPEVQKENLRKALKREQSAYLHAVRSCVSDTLKQVNRNVSNK
jgi:hypothetical protein